MGCIFFVLFTMIILHTPQNRQSSQVRGGRVRIWVVMITAGDVVVFMMMTMRIYKMYINFFFGNFRFICERINSSYNSTFKVCY